MEWTLRTLDAIKEYQGSASGVKVTSEKSKTTFFERENSFSFSTSATSLSRLRSMIAFSPVLHPYHDLHDMTTYLINTLLMPHFGSEYLVNGLLCKILAYLASEEHYHCTRVDVSMHNDSLLFSRIAHLMEEKHGRITRSELSGLLNYSGDYLSRIVKKFSGLSLYEYRMTFCLNHSDIVRSGNGKTPVIQRKVVFMEEMSKEELQRFLIKEAQRGSTEIYLFSGNQAHDRLLKAFLIHIYISHQRFRSRGFLPE